MSTVKKHAIFSPSAMAANMACIGKIAMEHGLPDTSSSYADEGTCAHFLGAYCLENKSNAMDYFGDTVALWRDKTGKEGEGFKIDKPAGAEIYHSELVDEVFAGHVQKYVDVVRDYAQGHPILVEQKLSIAEITGEWYDDPEAMPCCEGVPNGDACPTCGTLIRKVPATGTTDAGVLLPEEAVIVDAKFGRIEVSATAEGEEGEGDEDTDEVETGNVQLLTYAAALIRHYAKSGYRPKRVRLVIVQPLIGRVNEFVCSVDDIKAFERKIRSRANLSFIALEQRDTWIGTSRQNLYLTPGVLQCKFCKAAQTGRCSALDAEAEKFLGREFSALDFSEKPNFTDQSVSPEVLGHKLRAIPFVKKAIEGYATAGKAVLFDNANSPEVCEKLGFKLVQGRRGNRQWKQDEKLERLLKRLLGAANCYTKKLISPADAEKALKGEKSWGNVEKYITQPEGKPSVAPLADKREPLVLQTVADEFEDLTAGEDLI